MYYQARISEIAKQLAERKGEYDEIKQQLKEANFKLDDFVKENRHLINLCAEKNNEFEIKSKLCENLKKMLEDFEQEEIRLNEELKHAKKLIEKLEKSINSETQKVLKTFLFKKNFSKEFNLILFIYTNKDRHT